MNKFAIGIDAGFTHIGVSVFRINKNGKLKFADCFVTVTTKNKKEKFVFEDDVKRIEKLISELDAFLWNPERTPFNSYIVTELPTGGSKSSRAGRSMGMATGLLVAYFKVKDIKNVSYIRPTDVKKVFKKDKKKRKDPSKDEIMFYVKKILKPYRNKIPKAKSRFEHIADSVGCIVHAKNNIKVFKEFCNKK